MRTQTYAILKTTVYSSNGHSYLSFKNKIYWTQLHAERSISGTYRRDISIRWAPASNTNIF